MRNEDGWRQEAAAELERVRLEAEELLGRHHAELCDMWSRLEEARRRAGLAIEPGGVVELPADEPERPAEEDEDSPFVEESYVLSDRAYDAARERGEL